MQDKWIVEEDEAEESFAEKDATLIKGCKFYNKLFNLPTIIQNEQPSNITDWQY
jgi:hypothetical protein